MFVQGDKVMVFILHQLVLLLRYFLYASIGTTACTWFGILVKSEMIFYSMLNTHLFFNWEEFKFIMF